ncbi:MAG: DNA internalization-related competence protein ComEC/Rec2 [Lachnospiraceae bacterium]|nr:DNA internalization-related competence protein ComEC/Rec2 [Lachnospiraceae bacterium]
MKRPLVWAGSAYIAGMALGAAGLGILPVLIAAAAAVIITRKTGGNLVQRLLPVFLLSGFAVFCRAEKEACKTDILFENTNKVSIAFEGKITDISEKENSCAVTVSCTVFVPEDDPNQIRGTVVLIWYAGKEEAKWFSVEDKVSGEGTASPFEEASNPGQFDAASYYRAAGIDCRLTPSYKRIEHLPGNFRRLLWSLRNKCRSVFSAIMDPEEAAILNAMLLGDKSMVSEETIELYRKMSVIHILTVSGLHVSLIGRSLYRILRKAGIPLAAASFISSFAVLSYAALTGGGASAKRAAIMFLINMGAEYFGRTYDMLSAVFLAAGLQLTADPLLITQSGMQFSYTAVTALVILSPALKDCLPRYFREDPGGGRLKYKKRHIKAKGVGLKYFFTEGEGHAAVIRAAGSFVSCLSVIAGTLPLAAYYYGEIPITGLFVNLLVIPVAGLIIPAGLVTALLGMVSVSAAVFTGGGVHVLIFLNNLVCSAAGKIPGSTILTGSAPFWVLMIYIFGIVLFYVFWRKGKARPLFLVICLIIMIPFRRLTSFSAFIDVGQGDCAFIRTDSGETFLIDGGSSDVSQVGEYRIEPFLRYYGEDGCDWALVSHGDEDHISGIRELLEDGFIRNLVLTKASSGNEKCAELAELALQAGTKVWYISTGDSYSSGKWSITCLYPEESLPSDTEGNDTSMVLSVSCPGAGFLFTGDITENAEHLIAEQYGMRHDTGERIYVLKCPHHGSKYSSSEVFLETVHPDLTVISCSKYNNYGHPSPEAVSRIASSGSSMLFTMDDGAVTVGISGKVRTYKGHYGSNIGRFVLNLLCR